MYMLDEIIKILPEKIAMKISTVNSTLGITEIRLRVGKKVVIISSNTELFLSYVVTLQDLLDILINVSKNSIYAIQNDINNGFIVIKGGHRIGVCGEVVIQDFKVKNIKNINSMNIRVARQIIGCADNIMPYLIKDSKFTSTLIVSPPGCGKTTILRDIIRQISNGIIKLNYSGQNIGIVDERGEIASVNNGIANLDVGIRTDIISHSPKSIGMEMLIRSMGIEVLATDEIGTKEDIKAIEYGIVSGVSLLFTIHGKDINDLKNKENISKLINNSSFENVIILSNRKGVGTIEQVYNLKAKMEVGV